jgi:response regulator RpfG family c-di-GMP phosphodiesterase
MDAPEKKTLLMYSPDASLCMCFSMLYQDNYNVVTTTDIVRLGRLTRSHPPDVLVVDAEPSEELLSQLQAAKRIRCDLPILLFYVFDSREGSMDERVRSHVDTVFYKPFDIQNVSRRLEEIFHRS